MIDLGFDIGTGEKVKIKIGKGPAAKEGETFVPKSTKEFEVDGSTTLEEFANLVSKAGYNASFDESTGRFFVSSKESGADNNFEFISEGVGAQIQDKLKLVDIGEGSNGGAVKIAGADAEIELNGAKFTSASNSFSINGLTITAKEVTSSAISLVTDTDYDDIYDTIKNFFNEYTSNKLSVV